MTGFKLFGSLYSGHSYKVRQAFLLCGIPHEYQAIDIAMPRDKRDSEWRSAATFGEVPVLLDNGKSYVQSNGILLHLARKFPALQGPYTISDIESWLFWESNRIGGSLPNYRYLKLFEGSRDKAAMDWLFKRMLADMASLEERLSDRPYLLGDTISSVDMSCSGYLQYRDLPDLDLHAYQNVMDWLDRISAQPGWLSPQNCMG
ncbi:MAG: glutathione S-transferase family protein [Usitatibacteraceae bacterium]